MIDSTDELRAILKGTALSGREVVAIEVPASRGGGGPTTPVDPPVVLAVRIDPHELMAAWTVARELLDRTGRWPVANCSFDFELDDSSELGAIVDNLDRVEYAFGRPPTTIEGALALARQQELIAPCTTAMPGASTEELAASLRSAGTWFLHERP